MRIVIAEDQILLRDGIARLLTDAGHTVVGQVGDGRSLIAAVGSERPDPIIADIRMPPTYTDEGAAAVIFLRERFETLAVVVLSQVVDPSLVAELSRGQVRSFGYLLKDRVLDTEVFLGQLTAVGEGGTVIDPLVIGRSLRSDDLRLGTLTEREVEVLRLVASGRSNPGIAADLVISRRTVDAHLRAIFTKLGIESDSGDNQRVLAALDWLTAGDRQLNGGRASRH